jgi:hypothetical protein
MFDTWILFGEPSLRVVGTASPPKGIQVTPSGGLVSSGPPGGPFTPSSIDYTVKNVGTTPLNYTVAKTQPWVSLTNPSGALPGGASVIVQVSINSLANAAGSGTYLDTVAFTNTTDHMGDTARSVMLKVGVPSLQYSWNMDTSPGWTVEGLWAWGQPTGQGGQYGYPDPTSGYTGPNVYGYNLSGDYTNSMPERNLTSAALNCSGMSEVSLRFWRRLGVDLPTRDHAYARVSTNGTSWTTLWENTAAVTDSAWVYQQFDLSSLATNQPTVYLRWTMGTTNSTRQYCGWNLDDIEVWGLPPGGSIYPRGDLNCDGQVNFGDINPFVLALTDPVAYAAAFPYCNVNLADINGDGVVNFGDINPFVALLSPP